MADSKITALTALTAADPVNDMFPVVDVSDTSMAASGTTKRISANNILSSSPTATGAFSVTGLVTAGSAAITGDLTVDTSTLKVDSTNNRVGVGTASPTVPLDVLGSGDGELRLRAGSDSALIFSETTANKNWKVKPSSGTLCFQYSATAFNSGYANLMVVTETGNVGVGVTPNTWTTYKALQVNGASIWSTTGNDTAYASNVYYDGAYKFRSASSDKACMYIQFGGQHQFHYTASAGTAGNTATFTQAMTLDASGNLLVGVTSAIFNSRLRVKTNSASASDYGFYVADNADALMFALRNDGLFYTGLKTASPYNNTTGSAANVFVAADGTLARSTSSLKYKTDVKDSIHGLADVLKLRSVTYKSKNGDDTVFGGLIAEEVHAAGLTEFVAYAPDKNPDSINYGNMVALLVSAIQELTARVQTLEAR